MVAKSTRLPVDINDELAGMILSLRARFDRLSDADRSRLRMIRHQSEPSTEIECVLDLATAIGLDVMTAFDLAVKEREAES